MSTETIERLLRGEGARRTRLYRLKPFGQGTGQVESLLSYVQRLALAHHLKAAELNRRFLCWIAAGQPDRIGEAYLARRDGPSMPLSNLDADTRLSSTLSEATSIPSLAELGVSRFGDAFGKVGMARPLRWCPHCYLEQRYMRLLWTVDVVRACPVHRTPLVEQCPGCGAREGGPVPRFACKCHQVGSTGERAKPAQVNAARDIATLLERRDELTFDVFSIADGVAESAKSKGFDPEALLRACGSRSPRGQLAGTIPHSFGPLLLAARKLRQPFMALFRNCASKARPSAVRREDLLAKRVDRVRGALHSMGTTLSLAEAALRLAVNVGFLRQHLPRECEALEVALDQRRQQDAEALRQRLASHDDPRLSLSELAHRWGMQPGVLSNRFPKEAAKIVRAHKTWRRARKRARLKASARRSARAAERAAAREAGSGP